MKHSIVLMMIIVLALTACGAQPEKTAYEVVSPAKIEAGSTIPAPSGDVVLTLSGNIAVTNVDDTLALDIATLEDMGLVKYTINDPWLETEVTYSGVLVSDLLKIVGSSDSNKTLVISALDGYVVDIPISELEALPVLLATRADGEWLTVANNGPSRIIFPYDNHPDETTARNMSAWNVEYIEIK